MCFWEKAGLFLEGGEPQYLDRSDLETVFPHKGAALVGNCGLIESGACSLYLEPNGLKPYLKGHEWYVPAHWLSEMAAQAGGLQAALALYEKLGNEARELNLPSFIKTGDWQKKPLTTSPKSGEVISATVILDDFSFRYMHGMATYMVNVLIRQGKNEAIYEGLRVMISKGR